MRHCIVLGDRIKHNKGFGNNVSTFISKWLYRSRFEWMFAYPVMMEDVSKVRVKSAKKKKKKEKEGKTRINEKKISSLWKFN